MLPVSDERDLLRFTKIVNLLEKSSSKLIGDILIEATQLFEELENPISRKIAEEAMKSFRSISNQIDPSIPLFSNPPKLQRPLSDIEFIQLCHLELTIHELCYACEMVQIAAENTNGGSTPTRFYLTAIYHYISSLFLVDLSKSSHKDFPIGGTVIRALFPLGLQNLLVPLKEVFDEPFGDTTYGNSILDVRHSDLVHGDFSPERIEYIVRKTQMRDSSQQDHFAELTWKFFHRLIIFHLQLLTIINSTGLDPISVTRRYMESIKQR